MDCASHGAIFCDMDDPACAMTERASAVRDARNDAGHAKAASTVPARLQLERQALSIKAPSRRSADQEAEARAGHGAGLAGHCAVKTLALKRGRQVHCAAVAEHTGQEFHDTSPCKVTRGAFAWWSGATRLVLRI